MIATTAEGGKEPELLVALVWVSMTGAGWRYISSTQPVDSDSAPSLPGAGIHP